MRDHYLAQFRLRQFAGENGQVAVLDKQSGRTRWKHPVETAYEDGFYKYTDEDGATINADEALRPLERAAAPVFRRLAAGGLIGDLPTEDWPVLLRYIAAEWLRSPRAKRLLLDHAGALRSHLHRFPPGSAAATLASTTEAEAAATVLSMIQNETGALATLLGRFPTLYDAPEGMEFIIGDHPIAMDGDKDRGNLRWLVPVSPTKLLVLFDSRQCDSTERGLPALSFDRVNELQVRFAERFVFARGKAALAAAQSLIQEDPSAALGARPNVRIRQDELDSL